MNNGTPEKRGVQRYRVGFSESTGWFVSCASIANTDVVLASDYDILRKCYDGQNEFGNRILAERDTLQRDLAAALERVKELERDSERLDWLANPALAVRVTANAERTSWSVVDMSNGLTFLSRSMITMRAAIDAARTALSGAPK
jgi:hypothetical protein